MNCVAFWFRRDLRLEDNRGLYEALQQKLPVMPVFIFDQHILDGLHQKSDGRVEFIHHSLQQLKSALRPFGSDVIIQYGNPETIWKALIPKFNVKAVFVNRDYESYAVRRDLKIAEICRDHNIPFESYKDHVLFEKHEVSKDDGTAYTVYTPFKNKLRTILAQGYDKPFLSPALDSFPSEANLEKFMHMPVSNMPGLDEMGFQRTGGRYPPPTPIASQIHHYHLNRDYPSREGTSKLGIHLRFGTISIRKLAKMALEHNETYFNELVWRDFYSMILQAFPHVEFRSFKPAYDRIEWRNNESEFKAWCEGRTGYPMVDAGIRELNATGFMHNRLRMITASFLVKHLLIDWRWGEAYFAEKLLDFDLGSNNGGWQWAAGCGTDAAPYFRIFSPQAQQDRFDPKLEYVRKWIPELESFSYPGPVVDHKFARQRCLEVFQAALKG